MSAPHVNFALRMIFLLWLVAVVCTSEDIELQTSSPVIADVVQTKSVHVLVEDELQFDAESETESEPEEDTTDMPESLIVFQEVTKLDDILRDENPIVVNDKELASRNENLELNEISNNLGDDDIVDVIHNFIADKDPMLQVMFRLYLVKPFGPFKTKDYILYIRSLSAREIYSVIHF